MQYINEIIAALKQRYPDALCALQYDKDYELMIAVRLSAQCTDARVNLVTPALFARFPTLDAFAGADVAEVETYVHSCGFYRQKAKDIVQACRMLRDEHGGRVPDTMEALLKLKTIPAIVQKTELINAMIDGEYLLARFSLERAEFVRKELRDLMAYLPNEKN